MSEYRRSDNLLRLHGACLRRPHVAIVYELMAGNLHERIYSPLQEPMGLLEALHIARAVANGLDELHPNVVHRDLKVTGKSARRQILASSQSFLIAFGIMAGKWPPFRVDPCSAADSSS